MDFDKARGVIYGLATRQTANRPERGNPYVMVGNTLLGFFTDLFQWKRISAVLAVCGNGIGTVTCITGCSASRRQD